MGRRWVKGGWRKQSDGRQVEKRRADGGVNGGMRVERRENK